MVCVSSEDRTTGETLNGPGASEKFEFQAKRFNANATVDWITCSQMSAHPLKCANKYHRHLEWCCFELRPALSPLKALRTKIRFIPSIFFRFGT